MAAPTHATQPSTWSLNDPQRASVWFDTYVLEFSRDFELSKEGGDRIYRVMASCVRLFKAAKRCADAPDELCCTTADKEVFANAWALHDGAGSDSMVSTNATEVALLVTQGWQEQCAPATAPLSSASTRAAGGMLRGLHRCRGGGGHYTHALDLPSTRRRSSCSWGLSVETRFLTRRCTGQTWRHARHSLSSPGHAGWRRLPKCACAAAYC